MPWEDVLPGGGGSVNDASGVNIGWRDTGRGKWRLAVNISERRRLDLGWGKGAHIRVQRDRVAGKLRFWQDKDAMRGVNAFRLQVREMGGILLVPLAELQLKERKLAAPAPFVIEDGALIVTLPDWAAPERLGHIRAQQAAALARARLDAKSDPFRRYS